MPIKKVLVANRGEIAVRIIRTCKELGIQTIAVFSEADRDSAHARLADRAVCIGPASASKSYLQQATLIGVAQATGADAVHPGYGFLAENAEFAALCEAQGLAWIGPSAALIRLMGNKAEARKTAAQAGVPVIPGSETILADAAAAVQTARKLGYPVLLKASAGGGGRGMRRVNSDDEMARSFDQARSEAQSAFGDGSLYLEKFLVGVRHIEVQILGDARGTVVHLGERDCTLQRRHQKLVEEGPSSLSPALRRQLTEAAVRLGEVSGYRGAGTVEFVFDPASQQFYFIEVNCRIQVEHPVTEGITGIDIVSEQLRVAGGEGLSFVQADVRPRGHAIECRINAEDAAENFRPCPGTLTAFSPPGGMGVRVDTHCYSGYAVPPHYDSLLAKLVVTAPDRDQAVRRMRRALGEFVVAGIPTTIPFLLQVLEAPDFVSNRIHTRWIEETFMAGKIAAPGQQ
jgi:acetyl-CoA carboxylase biotin carboxylase subunit